MKEILPDIFDRDLLRELAPQGRGAVVRRFRAFSTVEHAVQEAMLAAYPQWPKQGVPEDSRTCLIEIAFLRLTRHVQSENARRGEESSVLRDAGSMVDLSCCEHNTRPGR